MASALARIQLKPLSAARTAKRADADVGPVVKWAGGKTRLLPELLERRPTTFRRYFEPFVGGAAMFFRLGPSDAVLSDCNADLINMYRCVAWNVEAVIKRLRAHKRNHSTEHYYEARDRFNAGKAPANGRTSVQRAAMFIYLNKTCYNGLWRVNSRGGFNVPMGRYDNPTICETSRLRAASRILQKAELEVGSYADAVAGARAGDFVYFDPPYHPVSPTASFTSYTAGDFSEDDQRDLASLVKQLDGRGVHVMVSNSDTPFIRKLYRGLRVDTVTCARAINSKASSRGAVNEVIVTNR